MFCVMRVMSFVVEKGVLQFIVCKCVAGYLGLGFSEGVVDDLDL